MTLTELVADAIEAARVRVPSSGARIARAMDAVRAAEGAAYEAGKAAELARIVGYLDAQIEAGQPEMDPASMEDAALVLSEREIESLAAWAGVELLRMLRGRLADRGDGGHETAGGPLR